MYKKLMLGTVLMTNLNTLPAVQRAVPRTASSARTLATRTSALAPQVLQPTIRLAVSNSLSRIVANQEHSKSNLRTYLALAGLAAAAGVNEVAKCESAADRRLLSAIWNGNERRARRALEDGANVNAVDLRGGTSLHKAAYYGKVEVVRELLKRPDINVNVADEYGATPLHIAAFWGKVGAVQELLKRSDINVNVVDLRGDTPLCDAVYWDRVEVAQELLKRTDIKIASVEQLSFIRRHKEALGADLVALAESKASKMVRLLACS